VRSESVPQHSTAFHSIRFFTGKPIARYNNPLSLWVWTSILGVVATAIGTAINLLVGH
jgi:ABC-type multidrug transport system permease subunit